MAKRQTIIPQYGTVMKKGVLYYRTRIKDANGKLIALYAKTPEELYKRETIALEQIENATFHRKTPTVAEYCEKWLLMQSVHVRATTLTDYTSKVRRHIIAELGDKRMGEVSLDDIQLALVPVSKKSVSVYKSVVILYKSIFRSAMESRIIDHNPTIHLTTKGGGVPQEDRLALTDEQVERLLDAIRGLPPYVFVMIGLYAGLRREEILALQWDSVYLDTDTPYLTVRRAWHTEHNRPVILDELKTKAAERNIPLPVCLEFHLSRLVYVLLRDVLAPIFQQHGSQLGAAEPGRFLHIIADVLCRKIPFLQNDPQAGEIHPQCLAMTFDVFQAVCLHLV